MTKIILARHGHVAWIEPERFRGRADLALSRTGEQQARALADRIARSWKPDTIYTSPLSRCVRTGEAITGVTGTPAHTLAALSDTDYGQWQGLTHEEVMRRWPAELRLWFRTPERAQIPDGETLADVLVRATLVLNTVIREHEGQTVVLVGHDSINRVVLLHCLGLPLSHYWRIKQEPCCINEITSDDSGFTVNRVNETFHTFDIATGTNG